MKQEKLVKRSLPCSFYDIEGIHSWLDEMALQGLFLHHLSDHSDRAYFERGEPRPVRYRLDPLGEKWNDVERKENYAQMGWQFVDAIPRAFYIFSCGDPQVPELHSDPETMGYALSRMLRRKTRREGLLTLLLIPLIGVICYLSRKDILPNLILWEYPLLPLWFFALLLLMVGSVVGTILLFRRIWTDCRTLEQGLPLKAGRRRKGWRPPYFVVYLAIYIPLQFLFYYGQEFTTVEDCGPSALSHPWLAVAQEAIAAPDDQRISWSSTVRHNSLTPPTAPVQERVFLGTAGNRMDTSENRIRGELTVRYVQTASPGLAGKVFQIERDRIYEELELWSRFPGNIWSVSELTPFSPLDRPGLDRLDAAQYQCFGRKAYVFVLQRENEVLMVNCSGFAPLEDCLELFLEALDQKEDTL